MSFGIGRRKNWSTVGARSMMRGALASGGPAVVHVDVDPVKHMWVPGLIHFKDMHQEPKGR